MKTITHVQDVDSDEVRLDLRHAVCESDHFAKKLWEQLYIMAKGRKFARMYDMLCDLKAFEDLVDQAYDTLEPKTLYWHPYPSMSGGTIARPWFPCIDEGDVYKITFDAEQSSFTIRRMTEV
jgi:hypothetical protein